MKEKLRILLVDPSEKWVTNNSNLKYYEQVMVPIGLMALSAFLKQKFPNEIETKIISTIVDLDGIEQINEVLDEFSPQIVGIRAVAFYNEIVNALADICKEKDPNILLLAGGPDISIENNLLLDNKNIDLFMEGEGEEVFSEIVGYYINTGVAGLLKHVKNIKVYWKKRKNFMKKNWITKKTFTMKKNRIC